MPGIGGKLLSKMFMNDAGKISKWKVGNGIVMGGMGISEYGDKRAEGGSVVGSAVETAADTALGIFAPGLYMVGGGIAMAASHGVEAYDKLSAYGRSLQRQSRNTPFQNATFLDSQQTYTMRQAGMNLARQGQYAAQQTTMGNEASSVAYMGH